MNDGKARIVVVDDDEKHLTTTRELLEMAGYEVFIHNSPFGTTEMVNSLKPELVLLDVNMPALSGDRLCALIRANGGLNVRVLFYSSSDEDSLRASVDRFGADGYVCKGDIPGLRRKVDQLARRPVVPR